MLNIECASDGRYVDDGGLTLAEVCGAADRAHKEGRQSDAAILIAVAYRLLEERLERGSKPLMNNAEYPSYPGCQAFVGQATGRFLEEG